MSIIVKDHCVLMEISIFSIWKCRIILLIGINSEMEIITFLGFCSTVLLQLRATQSSQS